MKNEMILKENCDVEVPKCIGMISFVSHFLKQIWRADRGTIVFDSWVDIISNRHPIQNSVTQHFKCNFERA